MTDRFVASVADVALYDPANSDALIAFAKALTDSSITSSIETQEIRAGKGNEKVFEFKHSRVVDLAMTNAAFDHRFIAMQAGEAIVTGSEDLFVFDECITLDGAGAGTTASAVVGGVVYTITSSGTVLSCVPGGAGTDEITFATLASQTISVFYQKATTGVDKIEITGSGSPKIVKAVLSADIYDNTGLVGSVQIVIPRLQLDGAIEISMTPDGVASTGIGGTALAYSSGCGDSVYAEVYVSITGSTIAYSALAAVPGAVAVSTASPTATLVVYGLRGTLYGPVLLANSSLTFVSSDPTKATVNAAGVVTKAANGTTTITISLAGAESDTVLVTVT